MTTINIPMELEVECWNCEGTGKEKTGPNEGKPCDFCDGVGYRTTDFGDAVLTFMQRHGGQK